MKLASVRTLYKKQKPISGIFESNPVLKFGLALPFAVAGAITLKAAVVLMMAVCITVIPVALISYLVGEKLPKHLQIALYPILAMLFLIPLRYTVNAWDAVLMDTIGMYIYLVGASSLLISQAEHSSMRKRSLPKSMLKATCTCIGFCVVIGVIGAVREILGYGTIWGKPLPFQNISLYGVTYTFFGFILLGFIMAFAKAVRRMINGYLVVYEEKQCKAE